jgi:hypothetical protein
MPSSCSHVRLKAATLSVVSARKVLLPPAEDGRAPPVFNAYGGSRAFRFGTCNESHSMQSRQSTVVTITFLNAAGLTSVVQGSVSLRFTLIKTSQNPNFPPKYVSCRGLCLQKQVESLTTSWSTPLSRSVQHRAPALPGASRTCGPHGPPACYMAHPFSARDLARIALRACARTLQNVPNQYSSPPVCLCPVASAAKLIYKDA